MVKKNNKNNKNNKVIIIVSSVVVAVIVAIIVGIIVWNNSKNNNLPDDTEAVDFTETVTTEYEVPTTEIVTTEEVQSDIVITKTPVNSSSELSGGGSADLTLNYPVLESADYGENAVSFNGIITTEVEQFKNEYAQILSNEDYSDAESVSFEMNYEVYKQDGGIISLLISEDIYLGGAHSSTVYKSVNFNLYSGQSITLNDILGCDSDTYNSFIKSKILEKIKENPDNYFSLEENALDEAYSESNFTITSNGIMIFFQQYDIAPYSTGIPMFEFSYSDLSDIMPY